MTVSDIIQKTIHIIVLLIFVSYRLIIDQCISYTVTVFYKKKYFNL